ncbi:serine/threonine-protein kinase [Streptosporangium amethystogenes subsp. fukuiense]|uniref:non-specific serine/threonine protein kinase n=1 Tax=Streptosporangium amethystogenes subsp. fukuiense TaxID=698418 RepID=A0ABW2TA72_9ACTN
MTADGIEALLAGRYELLGEIGTGGMGTVWRARSVVTGEPVAVKVLHKNLSADDGLVLRFVQERNVLRALRHSHIVTMRDFVMGGDQLALVMDLVDGKDLRALLRERGSLPPAEAVRLVGQIADALTHAHAHGVVHRDVKPENVLVDAAGQARLTDFGVARLAHGPSLTQTSLILGTPSYLAPEVADGHSATPAVDVYAIGLVLYELLAGRPPFVGDHPMAVLRQHAISAPRRLAGMPDAVWSMITTCVAKDPARRPSIDHVAATAHALVPALAGLPALPPISRTADPAITREPLAPDVAPDMVVTSPRPRPESRSRPRRRLIGAAAVTTALAASAAVALVVNSSGEAALTPSAEPATAAAALAPTTARNTPPSPQADATSSKESPLPKPKPKPKPISSTPPITAAEPAEKDEATARPSPKSTRPKTEVTPEDEGPADTPASEQPQPQWRCRSWISTGDGTGTQMSPCMALVGDVFHLLGRIRGAADVRSDVHVQLYNTDADSNVAQPMICTGLSPAADGAVATCGPFTVTAQRVGAKLNVRQRWRRSGTSAFGGGSESPWVFW